MNILLINHYAGSPVHGMEFRPYYLARQWIAAGHEVRILAASQSHLRTSAPQLHGRSELEQDIDGIHYHWVATPPYRANGIARAGNMAAFVWHLQRHAKRLARTWRPNLVIASSTYPLDIWPARRIATLAGATLVYEVHDLWPLTPIELGGMSARHPFIMLLQSAEDYACRHAERVVSILPKAGQHLVARGMAPHKLHVIPNGINPDDWREPHAPLDAALAARLAPLRARGHSIVGYAGHHGLANALDMLLAVASRMRHLPISFVLAGAGPCKLELQAHALALGLTQVLFVDPVPKAQIPALLGQFDLAYLGWRRHSLYRFGIAPNKLSDYMMAALPVVHAVEAGNDPVADTGCGLSVAPDDPDAVAAAITSLLDCAPARRRELGQRGRQHVLDHLSYPVLGQRFLAACT